MSPSLKNTYLPRNTPQVTNPIDSFTVRFKDGSVKKVTVGEGEGFFRESEFKGEKKTFTTYECFVAEGELKEIPSGKER